MKFATRSRRLLALGAALTTFAVASTAALADDKHRNKQTRDNAKPPVASSALDTSGRLLASNCFQCHGTNGSGGFESIRGSGEVYQELLEFVNGGEDPGGIMAAHTKGYTIEQLRAIANYLQRQ